MKDDFVINAGRRVGQSGHMIAYSVQTTKQISVLSKLGMVEQTEKL